MQQTVGGLATGQVVTVEAVSAVIGDGYVAVCSCGKDLNGAKAGRFYGPGDALAWAHAHIREHQREGT